MTEQRSNLTNVDLHAAFPGAAVMCTRRRMHDDIGCMLSWGRHSTWNCAPQKCTSDFVPRPSSSPSCARNHNFQSYPVIMPRKCRPSTFSSWHMQAPAVRSP